MKKRTGAQKRLYDRRSKLPRVFKPGDSLDSAIGKDGKTSSERRGDIMRNRNRAWYDPEIFW